MTAGNNKGCTFQGRALNIKQRLVASTTGPWKKEVLESDNGTL